MEKLLVALLQFADRVGEAKSNLAIIQSAAESIPDIILAVHKISSGDPIAAQIQATLNKYLETNFANVISTDLGVKVNEGQMAHDVVIALSKSFVGNIKQIDSELEQCLKKLENS